MRRKKSWGDLGQQGTGVGVTEQGACIRERRKKVSWESMWGRKEHERGVGQVCVREGACAADIPRHADMQAQQRLPTSHGRGSRRSNRRG